jgi:hypothetical protein
MKEIPDVNEIVFAIEALIDAKLKVDDNGDAVAFMRKRLSDILYSEIISKRKWDQSS